jgi:hypothetical protein
VEQQGEPENSADVEVYVHDLGGNRMGTGRWIVHADDTVVYENTAGEQRPATIVTATILRGSSSTWQRVPAGGATT